MKVLVLLALFSVCNANILWQEPKTNLEVVKDAFWDYVAKATQTAEDSLRQIQESQLGQDVNAKITASADTVSQYIVALKAQVAPQTESFISQFTQEAEQLKARLEKDLTAAGASLQPQVEELVAQLQAKVEELKRDAAPYAEAMDPEALKAVLQQRSQEMREQLERSATQLQAQMLPFTEEMKQKTEQSLDDFQKKMFPLAQEFETQVNQKTLELQQRLTAGGEELRAKLDASAQDVQAQLTALWESFSKISQ